MADDTYTRVTFDTEARKQLLNGLDIAARAVGVTLGPRGKCVLIQHVGHAPITTKDGVTVAKAINLRDSIARMGAELIKEAASQTNESAGDGTTTATILTHAMITEGMKLLEAGFSSVKLVEGMQLGVDRVVAALKSVAISVNTLEQIIQVGTISANGDKQIGSIIAEAMDKVGRDGIITVEDAKGMTTSLDTVEGMQFDRGYLSPYFVTNNEKMIALYNDAYVLVTDRTLTSLKELLPVLELCVKTQKPLYIVADNVEGEALQALVLNKLKATLSVVAVKSPGYGPHKVELLKDICVLTGATLISPTSGVNVEAVTTKELGSCKKLIVSAKSSTIVGDGKHKSAIDNHVAELRSQLESVTLDVDDVGKLRTRIAKLSGGVAIIKVGGLTEIEMVERKYRIEDALHATRAASEEGVVPGGGAALIHAWNMIETDDVSDREVRAGLDIIKKACYVPLRKIVSNAGGKPDVICNDFLKSKDNITMGYDASRDVFDDMYTCGVIDPCKVTRVALQNAVSVAVTFLTLDAVISNEERHNDGS